MNSTPLTSSGASASPRSDAPASPDADRQNRFEQALQRAERARTGVADERDEFGAQTPAAMPFAAALAGGVMLQDPGASGAVAPAHAASSFDATLAARTVAPASDPNAAQRWELSLPSPAGAPLAVQLSGGAQSPWNVRVLGSRGAEREALRASLGSLRTRLDSGTAQVGDVTVGGSAVGDNAEH